MKRGLFAAGDRQMKFGNGNISRYKKTNTYKTNLFFK